MNTGIVEAWDLAQRLARVEAGEAPETHLEGYEAACRPAALANADESFANLKRLAAVSQVIGPCADLAALERRLAGFSLAERKALDDAIELQRSHFLHDGCLPAEPMADGSSAPTDRRVGGVP